MNVQARDDKFIYLTKNGHFTLPTPPTMHNKGNYIVSLSNLVRWLGEQAEALGIEIYPDCPINEVLYDDKGNVTGVGKYKINKKKKKFSYFIFSHSKKKKTTKNNY